MGQFIALDAETDLRVPELDGDLVSYYRFILEKAFPGIPLEEIPAGQYTLSNNDSASYNYYKEILGEQPKFYIPGNNHSSRDVRSVLAHIADQENKYYYAWVENSMNPMLTQVGEVHVLDKLNRVNALVFYNINDEKKGNWKTYEGDWNNQNNYFAGQKASIPIWVGQYTRQSGDGPQKYFGVFAKSGFPFFLDTNDEWKFYQFQKQGQVYSSILTEKPGGMPSGFLDEGKLVYNKAWRKVYGLYLYRQFLVKKGKKGIDSKFIITRQLDSVLAQFSINPDGAELQFLDNFKPKQQVAAKEFADNYAKLLPPSYKCFYFRGANGDLQGFLSSVNTGEGRRGSGGYAMRADKVSEVNYLWGYNPGLNEVNWQIAFLLSHVMALEPQYWDNTHLYENYFPTNWPVEAQAYDVKTPVPKDSTSWFFYIKNFNGPDQNKRRNLPADPGPPRISGYQSQGYPHTFDTKGNGSALNNRSYRIWKKGDAFGGIALGDGTAKDRASAGSVMASALSDFTFYQGAEFPKSSLSATQFTGQMIQLDPKIKIQWQTDNSPSNPLLQTDQEWCHLLGHGDGGPEELGNFMAGSKHCNTEQLAIEVGQRRITHNDDIPKDAKGKFKAKITAYLFPNNGAWTDQVLTEAELRKKFELTEQRYEENKGKRKLSGSNDSIAETVFQEWYPRFFLDSTKGFYKLKDLNSVSMSFKALSDELKKVPDEYKKVEEKILKRESLFQFRQNLEQHFFQYLPIGRWMRYRIFYGGNKIFDHVYDAQSQSFNFHEAQILDYTVERVLYQALDNSGAMLTLKTDAGNVILPYYQYYKRKIQERVVRLVPSKQQIESLKIRKECYDSVYHFLSFQPPQSDSLVEKAKVLLEDMRKKPETGTSESAKAQKVIADFRNSFEEVITEIVDEQKAPNDLKTELQQAMDNANAASLVKTIDAQLDLAAIYEKFIATLT